MDLVKRADMIVRAERPPGPILELSPDRHTATAPCNRCGDVRPVTGLRTRPGDRLTRLCSRCLKKAAA
jgi:hypothetical protein